MQLKSVSQFEVLIQLLPGETQYQYQYSISGFLLHPAAQQLNSSGHPYSVSGVHTVVFCSRQRALQALSKSHSPAKKRV